MADYIGVFESSNVTLKANIAGGQHAKAASDNGWLYATHLHDFDVENNQAVRFKCLRLECSFNHRAACLQGEHTADIASNLARITSASIAALRCVFQHKLRHALAFICMAHANSFYMPRLGGSTGSTWAANCV